MTLHKAAVLVRGVVVSSQFFWVVLGFFVLGSTWVATASLYPMAFDEEFHFGLIQLYSQHWLPYGIENTRDLAQYGAAAADPSYLYHYLMSFPYRLFDWFGLSQTANIILLRFINVALVALSIIIFRNALLAARVSKPVANASVAAFSLVPILPMMAGQLNYDNLLLVMVALCFLLLFRITEYVRTHKNLPTTLTLAFLGTVLITMPIKYAFLPIVLGMGLWLTWLIFVVVRKQGLHPFRAHIFSSLKNTSKLTAWSLAALFVAGAFFNIRYFENYIRYNSPIPDCSVVFSEEACMEYGPWARNKNYKENLDPSFEAKSYPEYMIADWTTGMVMRLTFAVAGPTNGYQTKPPLPLHWPIAAIVVFSGLLALLRYGKTLYKKWPYIGAASLVSIVYVGTLSLKLYNEYAATGIPVAINGRYLLPLIPVVMAMCLQALLYAAGQLKIKNYVIAILAVLFIVAFIQGGGVFTYIVQSEAHWFWDGWGQASWKILHGVISFFTWQYNWFI